MRPGSDRPPPPLAPDPALPSRDELIALRVRAAAPGRRPPGASAGRAGEHAVRRTGRGLDFAELRPYQPGDDVRRIDWRHTARRGRPYTKTYHDEHERALVVLVDVGPSMRFGTRVTFKSAAAARAATLLAWSATAASDRVGGLVCDRGRLLALPPQRRDAGVIALIRALSAPLDRALQQAVAGPANPLAALARLAPPGSRVVLFSDFRNLGPERDLERLAAGRSLALVLVFDPIEATPPPPGLYALIDDEGECLLDLHAPAARDAYGEPFRERARRLAMLARRLRAPLVRLATDDDPAVALRALDPRRS